MDLSLQWAPPARSAVETPCRAEFQIAGVRSELDVVDVASVAFEHAAPVRNSPAWRGRKHYDGAQWMESSGQLVAFESLTERSCLIELDRWGDVAMVASQPMWLRWGMPILSEHVPDYFARMVDGASVLIDVKPAKYLGDQRVRSKLDRTACVARELGYQAVQSWSDEDVPPNPRDYDSEWEYEQAAAPLQAYEVAYYAVVAEIHQRLHDWMLTGVFDSTPVKSFGEHFEDA